MTNQLALLSDASRAADGPTWELDEHTRQVGRQGLAEAREALRRASSKLAA